MCEKVTTKLTPKVQHPERTKKFVSSIEEALELFDDHIGSLDETLWTNAYETLLKLYKEALTPIWNVARFVGVEMILKTIADKEMMSLTDMARRMQTTASYSEGLKGKMQSPRFGNNIFNVQRSVPHPEHARQRGLQLDC